MCIRDRNNSGKTSLTEIFYKFFGGEKTYFRFEDFCIDCCAKASVKSPNFNTALKYYNEYIQLQMDNASEEEVLLKELQFKKETPKIEATVINERIINCSLAFMIWYLT